MNLSVLSEEDRICWAQEHLKERFQARTTEKICCKITHGGSGSPGTLPNRLMVLLWAKDKDYDLWFYPSEHLQNRHWNGFGVEKPRENGRASLICEICVPYKGIDRKVQGAFAQDEDGKVQILHRGNFRGISKKDFKTEYKGTWVTARDGDQENEFVLIGSLDEDDLPLKVAAFVKEVNRIKSLTTVNP